MSSVTATRRDALVEAAFQRVAQSGFEGLRLRQVADDVGIDHSTLHHHIATRQALVEAVAEYAIGQFRATAPVGTSPAAALHHQLEALRLMMVQRPELFTVSAELDLRARRDPVVRAMLDGYESGWRSVLVEMFAGGTWAVSLRPQVAAEIVIAAVKGVRLVPDRAGEVFTQLEALLTGAPDQEQNRP